MKKILIIEDNDDIRENLAEILELAGYEAHTAENGKRGVEMVEQLLPDLILCDVMMPVLDGYGTLNILHKKPSTADIPFIFLTAKSEKADFRYGMNLGADDYITKPFETNEMLNVIELRLKRAERKQLDNKHNNDVLQFTNASKGLDALRNLTDKRETRIFFKKNPIYSEGGTPRFLYYIQRGKVKIFKTNADGKELIINILNKNDFFGQLALFSEGSYGESAAALEDCELTLIPKEYFIALLNENRNVSAQFIKILAGNVVEQEARLLNLAYDSVRKRVASALTILNEKYNNKPISMLREDLAALAGTAKETLIRTLADFKEEKMIEIDDGRITILKLDKLEQLLN